MEGFSACGEGPLCLASKELRNATAQHFHKLYTSVRAVVVFVYTVMILTQGIYPLASSARPWGKHWCGLLGSHVLVENYT